MSRRALRIGRSSGKTKYTRIACEWSGPALRAFHDCGTPDGVVHVGKKVRQRRAMPTESPVKSALDLFIDASATMRPFREPTVVWCEPILSRRPDRRAGPTVGACAGRANRAAQMSMRRSDSVLELGIEQERSNTSTKDRPRPPGRFLEHFRRAARASPPARDGRGRLHCPPTAKRRLTSHNLAVSM